MKKNHFNVLSELDFSFNNMKDKGMTALADGLQSLMHLTKLSGNTYTF